MPLSAPVKLTLRFGTYNADGSFSVNADKTIKTITVDLIQ